MHTINLYLIQDHDFDQLYRQKQTWRFVSYLNLAYITVEYMDKSRLNKYTGNIKCTVYEQVSPSDNYSLKLTKGLTVGKGTQISSNKNKSLTSICVMFDNKQSSNTCLLGIVHSTNGMCVYTRL